eukprot:c9004_g1_i1.p1 GENE.c9004_g1_i1~~c9004_g1_i1.p1  ORF type:complete len:270 (+),score=32.47 c9004_g1_i1:106-915(+)
MSLQEDRQLYDLRCTYGNRWDAIAARMPNRTANQCVERWSNHVDPSVRKGAWTLEEDATIARLTRQIGRKWAVIAKSLPGRTRNSVKNRFNNTISRWFDENHPLGGVPQVDSHNVSSQAGGDGEDDQDDESRSICAPFDLLAEAAENDQASKLDSIERVRLSIESVSKPAPSGTAAVARHAAALSRCVLGSTIKVESVGLATSDYQIGQSVVRDTQRTPSAPATPKPSDPRMSVHSLLAGDSKQSEEGPPPSLPSFMELVHAVHPQNLA